MFTRLGNNVLVGIILLYVCDLLFGYTCAKEMKRFESAVSEYRAGDLMYLAQYTPLVFLGLDIVMGEKGNSSLSRRVHREDERGGPERSTKKWADIRENGNAKNFLSPVPRKHDMVPSNPFRRGFSGDWLFRNCAVCSAQAGRSVSRDKIHQQDYQIAEDANRFATIWSVLSSWVYCGFGEITTSKDLHFYGCGICKPTRFQKCGRGDHHRMS